MEFYNIPLRINKIIKGDIVKDEIDLRESIHQNISLLLKTFFLSYRFDPSFGCILNKYQGSTPPQKQSKRAWRSDMQEAAQKNLEDMLKRYEKRIKVTEVIVDLDETNFNINDSIVDVRVQVKGQLTLGRRENFHFPDSEIADEAQEVFPLMIPVN